jgi:hypothetical protein
VQHGADGRPFCLPPFGDARWRLSSRLGVVHGVGEQAPPPPPTPIPSPSCSLRLHACVNVCVVAARGTRAPSSGCTNSWNTGDSSIVTCRQRPCRPQPLSRPRLPVQSAWLAPKPGPVFACVSSHVLFCVRVHFAEGARFARWCDRSPCLFSVARTGGSRVCLLRAAPGPDRSPHTVV